MHTEYVYMNTSEERGNEIDSLLMSTVLESFQGHHRPRSSAIAKAETRELNAVYRAKADIHQTDRQTPFVVLLSVTHAQPTAFVRLPKISKGME
jgi:hypothetical protein